MKINKMKALFKWSKPHIFIMIIIMLLTIIVPVTYSYVPQFVKYVFDCVLLPDPNAEITLPNFLTEFFDSFEKLESVLVVGITLVIFQLVRGGLMFLNGVLKGIYSERIAYDIRTKLYNHIQNLSFTYHNTVDTGDLIQRCTSDIDTIKNFISAQLPEILYIFASFISGAIQMAAINTNIMIITLCVIPITVTGGFLYFRYVSKKFDEVEEYEYIYIELTDEEMKRIDKVIRDYYIKIGKRIKYIGWVDSKQVYPLFLASDLAVFPGTHSVLWEQAMACGIPGLFKDWDGGFNHIDCGGNAKILKDISKESLNSEITRLIDEKEVYTKMKEIAETKGRKTFSYIEIAKKAIEFNYASIK